MKIYNANQKLYFKILVYYFSSMRWVSGMVVVAVGMNEQERKR